MSNAKNGGEKLRVWKYIRNFVEQSEVMKMLSVLIPTYNYDCTRLVGDLARQCDKLLRKGMVDDYEIVVADDGSTLLSALDANRVIAAMPHCRYMERETNTGRAAMRNFLMHKSCGDYLLFLDQDGRVVTDNFVEAFVGAMKDHYAVCGRMVQPPTPPQPQYRLRYDYERRYERRMTTDRLNADPKAPFRSFCFIIRRDVALQVPMDESFTGYGYEDVYYGMQLQRLAGKYHHIDNPLQNDDLEPNPTYLAKTEEAMRTLYDHRQQLSGGVHMLDIVATMQRMHLAAPLRLVARLAVKPLRRNLCSNRPMARWFNLYKLLYYINLSE